MAFRRVVLRIVLPISCAAVAAAAPRAGATLPDPRFNTIDAVVVGNTTGTAMGGAPAGFDVTMRDINNAPRANVIVTLDFSATVIRLYSTQNAGTTLNCAARTLSRTTDALGRVNFGTRLGGYSNSSLVQVIGDGEPLGVVMGRSTDLDGVDGKTGLGDLALFTANLLSNAAAQETDFDLNGTTGLGDLSLFATELLSHASGTYCP